MTKRKRPMVLLEAYEKIASHVPRTRLFMVGDGPLKEMVEKQIVEKGLKGRATVASDVSERALDELRHQASIFVLPSASEGISLALLEAMASGTAVIASRNESHAEILQHEKNALLFDLDNSGDLARKMLRVIRSPRLMSRLGKSARGLCETQFSNSSVARLSEDTYDQLLVNRSRKHEMRPG
jgi:glycosyltransferase involved in cell wall biosynthesis